MPSIKERTKEVEQEIEIVCKLLGTVEKDEQLYYQLRRTILENRLLLLEILERLKF
jgi:hypothetical protein